MSLRRVFKWMLAGALLLVVAAVVFLLTFDANRYRAEIQQLASGALGRQLTINGKLGIGRSLRPKITAEDVTLANPDWASRTNLATARRLELEIDLQALIGGNFKVLGATVLDADVMLERLPTGAKNWSFGRSGSSGGLFDLGPTRFENLVLAYRSDTRNWSTRVSTADLTLTSRKKLEIAASGQYADVDYQVSLGSQEGLSRPWMVDLQFTRGSSTAHWDGTLERLIPLDGVQAAVTLESEAWGELLGAEGIAGTGPLQASGFMTLNQGEYRLTEIQGNLQTAWGGHRLDVSEGRLVSQPGQPVALSLAAEMRGVPMSVTALVAARQSAGPPARIDVSIGSSQLHLTITDHPDPYFAGEISLNLTEPGPVVQAMGQPDLDLPSLELDTMLVVGDQRIEARALSARVGALPLSGDLVLDLHPDGKAQRSKLTGNLDTPNLPPLRGAGTGSGKSVLARELDLSWTREIDAELDLGVGRVEGPVTVTDLTLTANVASDRVRLAEIRARILGGELSGEVELSDTDAGVALDAALKLESAGLSAGGTINRLDFTGNSAGTTPEQLLTGLRGTFSGRDLAWAEAAVRLSNAEARVAPGAPVTVETTGEIAGHAVELSIAGGTWADLTRSGRSWPEMAVALQLPEYPGLSVAGTVGTLENILKGQGVTLDFSITSQDVTAKVNGNVADLRQWRDARLAAQANIAPPRARAWLGVSLADTPLTASGLISVNPTGVLAEDLQARWGHLQVSGNGGFQWGDPPALSARLNTPLIDLDQFERPPANDDPLPLPAAPPGSLLPRAKMDLTLRAERVIFKNRVLDHSQVLATLSDGTLDIEARATQIHDETSRGELRSTLKIESAVSPADWQLNVQADSIRVGAAKSGTLNASKPPSPTPDNHEHAAGVPMNADFRLTAHGRTVAELRGSLAGTVALHLGQGSFVRAPALLVGGGLIFQVVNWVNPFSSKSAGQQPPTALECAAVVATIDAGRLTMDNSFAIQTPGTNLIGSGFADLGTDELSLSFAVQQRKGLGISLGGLANRFLRIGGTLNKPEVQVGKAGSLRSGTAALATGGLSILATDLFGRATADKDACLAVMEGHESTRRLLPDSPLFRDDEQ